MPKSSQHDFDAQLQTLSNAWTYKLKSRFWPRRGKARVQSKALRNQAIQHMQAITEKNYLLSAEGRRALSIYDSKKQWHPKRGKGWGRIAKRDAFKQWYDDNIDSRNCVYVFWNKRKCLYVGRTGAGGERPTRHFEKYWFGRCTRIDVFGFKNKRSVAKYECLLTHKHKPTKARGKPASAHYSSNCPICGNNKFIKSQVLSIFPLRAKRRRNQ